MLGLRFSIRSLNVAAFAGACISQGIHRRERSHGTCWRASKRVAAASLFMAAMVFVDAREDPLSDQLLAMDLSEAANEVAGDESH